MCRLLYEVTHEVVREFVARLGHGDVVPAPSTVARAAPRILQGGYHTLTETLTTR